MPDTILSPFQYPSRVLAGAGVLGRFAEEGPAGLRRLFVVCGKSSMRDAGVLDEIERIAARAGIECLVHPRVSSNPDDTDVDEICDTRDAFVADAVMGVGGGSSLDVAKIVAMQATNGGRSWDYIRTEQRSARPIERDPLPWIAVPTTSGSASESTPYAVITHHDSRMKKGMGSPRLYPHTVLLDPELLGLMPPGLVAISGFDAYGQALEAYTSGRATPISDTFAFAALSTLTAAFEHSWAEPADHRAKLAMAWGTLQSGLAIGLVDVNLAHALSHPLSGRYGMPHGLAVLQCTLPAIRFNREVARDRYAAAGALFAGAPDDPEARVDVLIERIEGWARRFDIPLGLRHHEIAADELDRLARDALRIGAIRTNPRPVGLDDALTLYREAWKGEHA